MTIPSRVSGKSVFFSITTQAGVVKDVSADVEEVTGIVPEREMSDCTGGGSTGHKNSPGLQNASPTIKGFLNATTDGLWDVIKDYLTDTAARAFVYGPAGNTAGYPKFSGSLWIKKPVIDTKTSDGVIPLSISFAMQDGITPGTF